MISFLNLCSDQPTCSPPRSSQDHVFSCALHVRPNSLEHNRPSGIRSWCAKPYLEHIFFWHSWWGSKATDANRKQTLVSGIKSVCHLPLNLTSNPLLHFHPFKSYQLHHLFKSPDSDTDSFTLMVPLTSLHLYLMLRGYTKRWRFVTKYPFLMSWGREQAGTAARCSWCSKVDQCLGFMTCLHVGHSDRGPLCTVRLDISKE